MEKYQMELRTKTLLLFLLLFIGCGDSDRATQSVLPTPEVIYTPGEVVTDSQGYVSYRVGNTPIIITVPHDGTLTPSTFPDRSGATTRAENTNLLPPFTTLVIRFMWTNFSNISSAFLSFKFSIIKIPFRFLLRFLQKL